MIIHKRTMANENLYKEGMEMIGKNEKWKLLPLETGSSSDILDTSPQAHDDSLPANNPDEPGTCALVYRVDEIATMLSISLRAAYNLCNSTTEFKVMRIGNSIRVNKKSFDTWFSSKR